MWDEIYVRGRFTCVMFLQVYQEREILIFPLCVTQFVCVCVLFGVRPSAAHLT